MLEESILSAVIKHLSLSDTVRHLTTHEQGHSHEYFLLQEVVSETYRKLHAMIRQLQVSDTFRRRADSSLVVRLCLA